MGHYHHTLEEEEERYEHFEETGHLEGDVSPYDSRSPGMRSEDSLVVSSPEGSPAFHYSRSRRHEELDMDPDAWMDRVSSMHESR
jgi:hypothetical protein